MSISTPLRRRGAIAALAVALPALPEGSVIHVADFAVRPEEAR